MKNNLIKELTEKLKNKGFTKTDIASALGVREMTLYRWEKGLTIPKKAYVSVLRIMTGKENP